MFEAVFICFGYLIGFVYLVWVLGAGGGGSPKGLVHNLLMQFFSLGSSKITSQRLLDQSHAGLCIWGNTTYPPPHCHSLWSQYQKKKKVSETSTVELPRVKNCASTWCTGPFTHVSHYWWKQSFCVFGRGFDRLTARLEAAKSVLSYPSRHILSQHPHLHPLEWVPHGH